MQFHVYSKFPKDVRTDQKKIRRQKELISEIDPKDLKLMKLLLHSPVSSWRIADKIKTKTESNGRLHV
jgi:hypothetical protein